jgi:endo-1,4-beta-xylanase
MNRREVSFGAAAAVAAALAPSVRAEEPKRPPLKTVASERGVTFGVYMPAAVIDGDMKDERYLGLVAEHAGLVGGEHGPAVARVWSNPDKPDFWAFDAEMDFARKLGVPYLSWLFWNEYQPDWLKRASKAETADFMRRHVETLLFRAMDRAAYWEPVNEPIWPDHGVPGGLRDGPFTQAMGESYIDWAFAETKKLAPGARLILNEAHLERDDRYGRIQRPAFLALLDRLLDRGAPIDAVGLQGHIAPYAGYTSTGVQEVVGRIKEKGLAVVITEFDVDDRTFPTDAGKRDALVAAAGKRFLDDVFTVEKPEVLITFGLSDRFSWLRFDESAKAAQPGRTPRPLPFDEGYRPKPLEAALRASLDSLG